MSQVVSTYRSAWISEVYSELSHCPDDGHQTLDGVAVDYGLVLQTLVLAVARLVDDLHLFDNGALPALSGPQQQQLDLSARLLPIQGQLSVDLPGPLGGLLLQAGHCAPHHY